MILYNGIGTYGLVIKMHHVTIGLMVRYK